MWVSARSAETEESRSAASHQQWLALGGSFTRVCGVGWIILTDMSKARFFVLTGALAITLALGYMRFVCRKASTSKYGEGRTGDSGGLVDLEQRVRGLEDRITEAASASAEGAVGRKIPKSLYRYGRDCYLFKRSDRCVC